MKRYTPYLIITIVCLVAFRQVAFLSETLKYDILDGYLPGHFLLSESLRNGIFPLWNPYQQLGFPLYADMLNTNYIVDMLIGRFFPYTNVTFHILFIVYIVIAGSGMYKLSREFSIHEKFILPISVAYALSGFITGNAQHIQFIIGAAWLPFTIMYFIRIVKQGRVKDMLSFSLFTILLITGGYPSFAIFLAYILFLVYLIVIIKLINRKEYQSVVRITLLSLGSALLIAAMCSGVVISLFQTAPYVNRYIKLSYEYSVTNPFPPVSLLSAISPLATASHPAVFGTDISMNNHYFGVMLLPFLLYGFFRRNNLISVCLLAASVFILFFSFGEYFPVHRFFYEHVPLFNKFRHPSSFRFITILFLLLYSGYQVSRYDPTKHENFRVFKTVYLTFVAFILLAAGISFSYIIYRIVTVTDFRLSYESLVNDYGIAGPVFIQLSIILLINAVFVLLILARRKMEIFYPLITILLVAEAVVFTQLNMRYTVVSDYKPLEIRHFLRNSPAGFPLPDLRTVEENTEESVSFIPVIHNTNTYSKTVSPWYMYPFVLDGFSELKADTPLFKRVINHPLLYFDTNDSSNNRIICTRFTPVNMVFETQSDSDNKAVLLQNYFPGWHARVDGKEVEITKVHKALIGINVPAGNHVIEFSFRNPAYVNATLASFSLFLLLLIGIFFLQTRSSTGRIRLSYVTLIVIITTIAVIALLPARPFAGNEKLNRELILSKLKGVQEKECRNSLLVLLNTESQQPYDSALNDVQIKWQRFRDEKDVIMLNRFLDTVPYKKIIYIWSNVLEPGTLRPVIQMHFPRENKIAEGERFSVLEFSKDSSQTDSGISIVQSELFTADKEFGTTFRQKIGQLKNKTLKVFVTAQFTNPEGKEAYLVISVNRKGKSLFYTATPLNQFSKDLNEWNTAFAYDEWLSSSLRRGDEIVVYCWNKGRNSMLCIENLQVNIK